MSIIDVRRGFIKITSHLHLATHISIIMWCKCPQMHQNQCRLQTLSGGHAPKLALTFYIIAIWCDYNFPIHVIT